MATDLLSVAMVARAAMVHLAAVQAGARKVVITMATRAAWKETV